MPDEEKIFLFIATIISAPFIEIVVREVEHIAVSLCVETVNHRADVDVVYLYDEKSCRQIRHEIGNVMVNQTAVMMNRSEGGE